MVSMDPRPAPVMILLRRCRRPQVDGIEAAGGGGGRLWGGGGGAGVPHGDQGRELVRNRGRRAELQDDPPRSTARQAPAIFRAAGNWQSPQAVTAGSSKEGLAIEALMKRKTKILEEKND